MIRFVPWSEVGTITVSPGDNVVEVGAFELGEGADTLWVRMTNTDTPGPWPWSYGILSFKTEEGQPLGSVKAYNSFDGEVFRLGVGLAPSVRSGMLTFEPRGFNMAWIKEGNPWTLKFEAQSGDSSMTDQYLNRDPVNAVLSPRTPGDDFDLGTGDLSAAAGTFTGNIEVGETPANPGTPAITIGDGTIEMPFRNQAFAPFVDVGTVQTGYKYCRLNAGSSANSVIDVETADNASFLRGTKGGTKIVIENDGDVKVGGALPANPNITLESAGVLKLNGEGNGSRLYEGSGGFANALVIDGAPLEGVNGSIVLVTNSNEVARFKADGSATFVGNVVAPNITFRSATPVLRGDVDYAGPELDLLSELVRLEALVKHLYETLRLTPPAGWEVWDGNTDLVKSRGKKRNHI